MGEEEGLGGDKINPRSLQNQGLSPELSRLRTSPTVTKYVHILYSHTRVVSLIFGTQTQTPPPTFPLIPSLPLAASLRISTSTKSENIPFSQ